MNNKIALILALIFSLSSAGFSQSDARLANKIKTSFKNPLSQIGEKDLYMKSSVSILSDEEITELKKIIDDKGYPTISRVGESVAHLFWTLIMQCNTDVSFQMRVLKMMYHAKDKQEVDHQDFAMLVDRVLMNQDKPQLYGTQYVDAKESEEFKQYKIAKPENLEERRKTLNLPDVPTEKTKIFPKVKGTAQRGDPNARY